MEELQAELGFHELAIEDALGGHQRPKLDHYPNHQFPRDVPVSLEGGRLEKVEIDAFIHERWLVTVRKDEGFALDPVLERWDRSEDLAVHGVGFLVYGLLDIVIDQAFSTHRRVRRVLRRRERQRVLEDSRSGRRRHWFDMRKALIQFHRLVVPTREAVSVP